MTKWRRRCRRCIRRSPSRSRTVRSTETLNFGHKFLDWIKMSLRVQVYSARCHCMAFSRSYSWFRSATINARLTLFSNAANSHDSTFRTHAETVCHLLRRHSTKAATAKAYSETGIFKQGSVTLWDFSERLRDLTLRCNGIYNKRTQRRFLVEGIDPSIHSTIRRSWADYREAILEDLLRQAKSLSQFQDDQRNSTTTKNCKLIEVVGRAIKGPNGRGNQCRVMAVRTLVLRRRRVRVAFLYQGHVHKWWIKLLQHV